MLSENKLGVKIVVDINYKFKEMRNINNIKICPREEQVKQSNRLLFKL